MSYTFTDYDNMVGKKPRQTYFKELQDAVNDLDADLTTHLNDNMKHLVEGEKEVLSGLIWQNRTDTLKAGDLMAGYYGKVNGLITGEDLSTVVGLTAGTLCHSADITWLKFSHNYKTLLIADRAIRSEISWDNIQAQNLVKGKIVTIDDKYYLCRLIRGSNTNPENGIGGEWKDLIIKFTPNTEDSNWSNFYTICQEIRSTYIGSRICIGGEAVDELAWGPSNDIKAIGAIPYVWRPVLEFL